MRSLFSNDRGECFPMSQFNSRVLRSSCLRFVATWFFQLDVYQSEVLVFNCLLNMLSWLKLLIKLLLLYLFGCLYCWINDAQINKYQKNECTKCVASTIMSSTAGLTFILREICAAKGTATVRVYLVKCLALSEWRHHDVFGNQLVYTKRTSAQSIYSRVRLHVSTRG